MRQNIARVCSWKREMSGEAEYLGVKVSRSSTTARPHGLDSVKGTILATATSLTTRHPSSWWLLS